MTMGPSVTDLIYPSPYLTLRKYYRTLPVVKHKMYQQQFWPIKITWPDNKDDMTMLSIPTCGKMIKVAKKQHSYNVFKSFFLCILKLSDVSLLPIKAPDHISPIIYFRSSVSKNTPGHKCSTDHQVMSATNCFGTFHRPSFTWIDSNRKETISTDFLLKQGWMTSTG